MVATDVASRGIGMLANTPPLTFPFTHPFSSLPCLRPFCRLACAYMRDLNDVMLSNARSRSYSCYHNLVQGYYF